MTSQTTPRRKSALRRQLRRARMMRHIRRTVLMASLLCIGLLAGLGIGYAALPASGTNVPAHTDTAAPDIAEKLAVFRTVFADGRYWNHAAETDRLDPVLCVTDTPCAHSTAGEDTCNVYKGALLSEFPDFIGTQCFGYASLLSDLLFGTDAPVTRFDDFSALRAGDIIQFPVAMHTMLVTAVDAEAETVTVTEVNADYETCRIAWDQTYTKDKLYETDAQVTFYTRYAP